MAEPYRCYPAPDAHTLHKAMSVVPFLVLVTVPAPTLVPRDVMLGPPSAGIFQICGVPPRLELK